MILFKIRATRPFRILDQVRYLRVDLSECLNSPLQVSIPKSLLSIVVRRKAREAARGFANVEWFRRIGIDCVQCPLVTSGASVKCPLVRFSAGNHSTLEQAQPKRKEKNYLLGLNIHSLHDS